MRIGALQLASRIGAFERNARAIFDAVQSLGPCDLAVAPELAICGYPPRDLLLDPAFVRAAVDAVHGLARALDGGPPVLVGAPWPGPDGLWNAAMLLEGGSARIAARKRCLPAGDVFFEPRWFVPGRGDPPLAIGGRTVGVAVCEDLWASEPIPGEVHVALNASPFRRDVHDRRRAVAGRRGVPTVYVNAVGAVDELIFDGRSFTTAGAELPPFAELAAVFDPEDAHREPPAPAPTGLLEHALVAGLRAFFDDNRIPLAWVGLSGGVDSAVVACLLARALGPDRVRAVALPARFTDPRSTAAALELGERLGVRVEVHPLDALHAAVEAELARLPPGPDDTTAENALARARHLVLSAWVNRCGGALVNTSNRTELALGYGTLWADLSGTISPLGDLSKTDVYDLAATFHEIPAFVVARPPTAELRPDQVDPFDYAAIAPGIDALATGRGTPLPAGFPAEPWATRVRAAEHKRWVAGIVLHTRDGAFGTGRMMPVTRAR